jgi:hypothetical protein
VDLDRDYEQNTEEVAIGGQDILICLKNPIAKQVQLKINQMVGFMGMVPNITGVWVSCEDRSARFKTITWSRSNSGFYLFGAIS